MRFERELNALDLFGGDIAPELIWSHKTGILVYEYLEGIELHLTDYNKLNPALITNLIKEVHNKSRKNRNVLKDDVINYYSRLLDLFRKSSDEYPKKLTDKLDQLITIYSDMFDEYSENLTNVHGDLVPPNFIITDNKIKLIDWEFSRPELPFFDYQYFNYYAKAHSIPVQLSIPSKLETFYHDLVDVLEKLWRHGFLKKNKELIFDVEKP